MSRLSSLPVSLPPVSAPGNVVVSSDLAAEIVKKIQSLNEDSFVPDGVWRDSCAVTGTLRTFYGAASITRAWKDCLSLSKAINFQAAPVPPEEIRLPGGAFWVEVALNFETENTYSTALVSIIPDSTPANQGQAWKIWVLRTIVQQIKNAPRIDVYNPSVSNAHTEVAVSNNTSPRTSNQFTFDCVIVGAGQAGLDAAARCAAQQISYVVLDKEPRVGDSWRSRYDSARLHTTRDYTHLPYDRTFDESFPEYLGKDDLADAYEKYAQKMHLNVWLSSRLRSGHWNKTQQQWNLHVETDSEFREVVSKFVIMAIGPGGQIPVVPVFPGRVSLMRLSGSLSQLSSNIVLLTCHASRRRDFKEWFCTRRNTSRRRASPDVRVSWWVRPTQPMIL